MSCLNQGAATAAAAPQQEPGGFNSFESMQPRLPSSTPAEARNGKRGQGSRRASAGRLPAEQQRADAADALA